MVSVLRLQARSTTDPAVQAALASAVSRVDVVAKVHDRLRNTADSSRIDLAPYIEALCGASPTSIVGYARSRSVSAASISRC
ncbi:histidine kinase dimerization/phosphoacceptor domain -containing protein [Bradyrhizobium sp. CCGUVB14]|uniref:histidine kinase dimerization/phosphoacceptor domain -containing protein n=1 Tax=Bradyrhizobium sp. CCGUVB14 TaxID=2949628 RepID=UPI0035C0A739